MDIHAVDDANAVRVVGVEVIDDDSKLVVESVNADSVNKLEDNVSWMLAMNDDGGPPAAGGDNKGEQVPLFVDFERGIISTEKIAVAQITAPVQDLHEQQSQNTEMSSREKQNEEEKGQIKFQQLQFRDLEQYKRLLAEFPHGFIGILFKEICDNESGEFFAFGAFVDELLIGMSIGVKDFSKIRQFTEIENGLTAITGKKLSFVVCVVVTPEYRRKNVGRRLVEEFKKFTGGETTTFMLIPHKNMAAQQFFEKTGFEALSTIRKYFNEFEDAVMFVDKDSVSR